MKIERALLSVSDKRGLDGFATGLHELGVELVSTSGTAAFLRELGLPVVEVADLTGFPEMMDGRVRTLHPAVHGGLLARREVASDMAEIEARGIRPIDMLVSNLYPFRSVSMRRGSGEQDVIEAIDIGGPAMVRAAAKNFRSVAVVVDPDRYGFVLDELRDAGGALSPGTLRDLASEAFLHTAGYDAAVSAWFTDTDPFPDRIVLDLRKVCDLSYGENPHQRAAYYAEVGARRHVLSMVEQLQGEPPSFNNLADMQAARAIVTAFQVPACAIIKHANPCGVAVGASIEEAYVGALASDPLSAFGAVIAVNRPVTGELAARMGETRLDLLFAPGYEPEAVGLLATKPHTRVFDDRERRKVSPGERDLRRVLGGLLVQDRDSELDDRDAMQVVSARPPEKREWDDLLFAWRVAHYVRSNAIVLARDLATVGIGAGQMSRVDSVELAVKKAGDRAAGSLLASDGFFPFEDGPEAAFAAGVTAIIQPGGSVNDEQVVAAADRAGAAMVFTGRRHFLH